LGLACHEIIEIVGDDTRAEPGLGFVLVRGCCGSCRISEPDRVGLNTRGDTVLDEKLPQPLVGRLEGHFGLA